MSFLGRACRVASPYRGIFAITRPARGGMGSGFGTSYAHDPKWIEDWMSRKRIGSSEPSIASVSMSYSLNLLHGSTRSWSSAAFSAPTTGVAFGSTTGSESTRGAFTRTSHTSTRRRKSNASGEKKYSLQFVTDRIDAQLSNFDNIIIDDDNTRFWTGHGRACVSYSPSRSPQLASPDWRGW
ncbi:hypothetical protein FOZ61_002447 [Perkinsus olseni]|uniref:Uncharacterized protein n=1 Tax=Perkinsus olseni TaxID=32597 RepID=A0A7J6LUD1_PEROL|nr:hypothetical protein FOZ61_002447 [Perkinsus olseni]